MTRTIRRWAAVAVGLLVAATTLATLAPGAAAAPRPRSDPSGRSLSTSVYTAGPNAFGVTSSLITGRREAIVVDAQFLNSDAERFADRIAASASG